MKFDLIEKIKWAVVLLAGVCFLTACNKDDLVPRPITTTPASGQTIGQIISVPSFSVFKAAVAKAGLTAMLDDETTVFTIFAPDDAALARAGINAAVVAALPAAQVASIVQYHIVGGQRLTSSSIPTTFPNLQLPTELVLAPPSAAVPPGLRMSVFASKRGTTAWANNVPLTAVDIQAKNGVVHKTATVLAPPQKVLWERIATDPDLSYLREAVKRGDEASPSPGLVAGLSNPAANLTVFAPNNAAFQQVLAAQITQYLVVNLGLPLATAQAQAAVLVSTPDVFRNPLLAGVLTPSTVAGLVAYHVLGVRAFSVNLPTTETSYPTALASNLPGATVALKADFGPAGVTAATVKGKANATPSNILINPSPTNGTSDQHYVNGVLHVIDQVLRPQ